MDIQEAIKRKHEAVKPDYEPVVRTTLEVSEVATYLGLSRDFIYKLVRQKEIPHIKIGSRILFKKESLDKWLEDLENYA